MKRCAADRRVRPPARPSRRAPAPPEPERIVPAGRPDRRAELWCVALLARCGRLCGRVHRRLRVRRGSRTRPSTSGSRSASRSSSSPRPASWSPRTSWSPKSSRRTTRRRAPCPSRTRSCEIVEESGSRITRKRLVTGARWPPAGRSAPRSSCRRVSLGPDPRHRQALRHALAARPAAGRRRRAVRGRADIEEEDVLHRVPGGRRPRAARRAARPRATGPGRAPAAGWPRRLGAATESSPTRRSAPTPAARSPSTGRRSSRRSSRSRRSSARATTRPSTRRRGGEGDLRPGGAAAAAASAGRGPRRATCARPGTSRGPVGPAWWGVRSAEARA